MPPAQVLILTATVHPPANAPGMVRLDPQVRLDDYEAALDHYISFLGRPLDHIVFAENSGFSLQRLLDLVRMRDAASSVSFVQASCNDFPPEYGRCYGEVELLDLAMASDVVGAFSQDTVFWKSTGRYKLLNLQRMVKTRSPEWDLYVDLRDARGSRWADMRIMSWTRRGYDSFLKGSAPLLREDERGGRPGEEAAFDVLTERIAGSKLSTQAHFVTVPRVDGVRAYDNRNWSEGRQRIVTMLRQSQRTILGRILY